MRTSHDKSPPPNLERKQQGPLTAADLYRKFRDDLVVRFNATTVSEERALAKATELFLIDVWASDHIVDLRIQRKDLLPLLGTLPQSLRDGYITLIEDLPSAVLQSYPSVKPRNESSAKELWVAPAVTLGAPPKPHHGDEGLYFFNNYQPHSVVVRWMGLVEVMFPSFVRYITVGKSYEGLDIPALVVSGDLGRRDTSEPRKALVVMGGSHAREWISTTTVNYLAWAFITSYGKDKLITKFLQEYDIIFVPEMNPDGIEYTWNNDRLWRKSRQPSKDSPWCLGLDLDHAFGYGWQESWSSWRSWWSGVRNDPCSESYAGQEPWESVEVSAFRDWAKNEAETKNIDFVGLIDLHSYSQQILYPYTYTCDVEPPNVEKMEELALGLAKSIRLFSGEGYSVKPACQGAVTGTPVTQRIEPGGGSAIDWFYHELGAHYSYQVKLRDTGSYGFLLPADQIIPTGEEILQALKYLGDFLLGNDGIENMPAHIPANTDEALTENSEEPILELK